MTGERHQGGAPPGRQVEELEPPPNLHGPPRSGDHGVGDKLHAATEEEPGTPSPGRTARVQPGVWFATFVLKARDTLGRVQPGVWFLALALPAGLVLLFLTPPFQGLDEPNHFARTYTISQGELVTHRYDGRPGGYIPTCLADWVGLEFGPASRPGPFNPADFTRQAEACRPGATTFSYFPNTAYYSPVSYLPQTLGVLVARSLGGTPPVIFYAGRLAAFLAFLGMVFVSLRIAPRAHALIVVVGAWPMTLLAATTYSADTMTIALALLMVAAVLRARDEPEAWGPAITAFVAALGLALCKQTYFVLAPVILLVPARMFRRRSLSWSVKVAAIALIALATWGWYAQVAAEAAAPGGAADPHAMELLILHKPLWYLHFLVNMEFTGLGYPTWETFGAQVGFYRHFDQGEPFAPPWILLLGFVLLVLAYAREGRAIRWSWSGLLQASLPVVLVVVNFLVIFTAGFIEATSPKQLQLTLQGRYFLPFLPVLALPLVVLSRNHTRPRSVLPFLPFLGVMQAWLISDVYLAFYR